MPEVLMDEGNNNNNNNKVDDDALDPFASLTSAVEDAPLPALSLLPTPTAGIMTRASKIVAPDGILTSRKIMLVANV